MKKLPTNKEFSAIATQTAYATADKIGLQIARVYSAPNGTTVTFEFAPYGDFICPYYALDYQQHLNSIHIVGMKLDDDDVRREVFSQCYHLAKGLGVGKLNVIDPSSFVAAYALERGFREDLEYSMSHCKWYTLKVQNAKYTLKRGG